MRVCFCVCLLLPRCAHENSDRPKQARDAPRVLQGTVEPLDMALTHDARCARDCAGVAVDRTAEGGGDAHPCEKWAVTDEKLLLPRKSHTNKEKIGAKRCDFAEDGLFLRAVFLKITVVRADDLQPLEAVSQAICRHIGAEGKTAEEIDGFMMVCGVTEEALSDLDPGDTVADLATRQPCNANTVGDTQVGREQRLSDGFALLCGGEHFGVGGKEQ